MKTFQGRASDSPAWTERKAHVERLTGLSVPFLTQEANLSHDAAHTTLVVRPPPERWLGMERDIEKGVHGDCSFSRRRNNSSLCVAVRLYHDLIIVVPNLLPSKPPLRFGQPVMAQTNSLADKGSPNIASSTARELSRSTTKLRRGMNSVPTNSFGAWSASGATNTYDGPAPWSDSMQRSGPGVHANPQPAAQAIVVP